MRTAHSSSITGGESKYLLEFAGLDYGAEGRAHTPKATRTGRISRSLPPIRQDPDINPSRLFLEQKTERDRPSRPSSLSPFNRPHAPAVHAQAAPDRSPNTVRLDFLARKPRQHGRSMTSRRPAAAGEPWWRRFLDMRITHETPLLNKANISCLPGRYATGQPTANPFIIYHFVPLFASSCRTWGALGASRGKFSNPASSKGGHRLLCLLDSRQECGPASIARQSNTGRKSFSGKTPPQR